MAAETGMDSGTESACAFAGLLEAQRSWGRYAHSRQGESREAHRMASCRTGQDGLFQEDRRACMRIPRAQEVGRTLRQPRAQQRSKDLQQPGHQRESLEMRRRAHKTGRTPTQLAARMRPMEGGQRTQGVGECPAGK
jgi:hypothetical protein